MARLQFIRIDTIFSRPEEQVQPNEALEGQPSAEDQTAGAANSLRVKGLQQPSDLKVIQTDSIDLLFRS